MFDPTQFIVQPYVISNCFKHEGIVGKGRDFLTGTQCIMNLLTQPVTKKKYVMQLFEGVSNEFNNSKINQICKSAYQYYVPNYTKVVFMTSKKNVKNLMDLCIVYDVAELYGMSLENLINIQIKNGDVFKESQILEFLSQILDSLFLGGNQSFEYLEITPVNIFCKVEGKYKFKYFPNNFGLNFSGTKWEKKYYNPQDSFFKKQLHNIQNAMRSIIFMVGLVTLQMCTLQQPRTMFTQANKIDQKILNKTLQAIKLNYSNDLYQFICKMCILDQEKRIRLDQIYRQSYLTNIRKIKFQEGPLGKYKKFLGFVKDNQPQYFGDIINQSLQVYRGSLSKDKYEGYGVLETEKDKIYLGEFKNHEFKCGVCIKRNKSLILLSDFQKGKSNQGLQLMLQVYNLVSIESIIYYQGKLNAQLEREIGKCLYKDHSTYQGQFKNDKKNGKGVYISKDEKVQGTWHQGIFQSHNKSKKDIINYSN